MKRFLDRIVLVLITLFALAGLSSCDYFLPAPLGRDNPNDDGAQIRVFNSMVSGEKSIVTAWDWQDPDSTVPESQIIDKIRIVHKEDGRPTTWNPLNKDEVVEIVGNTEWKHEWTNLKQDRDHWFALYPHEKGGTWLAPKFMDEYLDSVPPSQTATLQSDDGVSPYEPSEFRVYEVTFSSTTDVSNANSFPWAVSDYLIISFNIYSAVYFDQFLLYLENNASGSVVSMEIYPLKKRAEDIQDWDDLISASTMDYDYMIKKEIPDLPYQQVDMESVINRVVLFNSGTLALKIDNPLTVDISNWTIDAHYWGNFY